MTPALFDRTRRWATLCLCLLAAGESIALAGAAAAASTVAAGLIGGDASLEGAGLAVAAAVCVAACAWLRAVTAEDFGMRYAAEVREALARHAIATARVGSMQASLGVMSARMAGDLVAIKDWVCAGLSDSVAASAAALAGVAILALMCGPLGVVVALVLASLGVVTCLVAFERLKRAWRDVRHARGRVAALVGDITLGARALALLDGGERSIARLNKRAEALRVASVSQRSAASLAQAPAAVSLALAFGVAIVLQAQGMTGPTTASDWALFIFATGLVVSAQSGAARACDAYAAFRVAHMRLRRLAAEAAAAVSTNQQRDDGVDEATTPPLGTADGLEIRIGDAWRGMDAGRVHWVTQPDPMASIGLVRDAAFATGSARYAGRRIDAVAPIRRARLFPIVTPEIGLVRGSVSSNLRLHRRSTTEQEMIRALALAGCGGDWTLDRMINPFDDSVDVAMQARLRLARAICGKPRVIFVADAGLLIAPDLQNLLHGVAQATGAVIVAAGGAPCEALGAPPVVGSH